MTFHYRSQPRDLQGQTLEAFSWLLSWRGVQDDRPVPRTVDRYLSDFTVEERRAMYDYTVSKTASVGAVKIEDLTSMFHKVDRPRAKTKLERLAEERDAKRRRVSERSRKVHTNRKSRTEILREVIMNQMELYEEWVKHTSENDPTEDFESRPEPPADKTNGGSYADLGSLHEGDIILSSSGRNAVLSQIYKWDDGIVPYVFHHSYESSEKDKVLSAMRQLEADVPCVRFVPWGTEAEYVEIGKRKELGCAAMVGCQRGHAHIVNYRAPECFQSAGIIQHELLHVLGLLHEQARPDRDEYVDIVWDNIHKDYWNDFKKASKNEFTTFDIPYDYKSIMHYPRNAFSKNGNDTIVAKTNPKLDLGQRDHPTENDLEKVRRMYNCSNVLPTVEIK